MKRFTEETVFTGLVTAWFFAALPTTRSPSLRKPTTEGVVRSPSALTRISGWEPSITAIAELVVPKSIPMIFAMMLILSVACLFPFSPGSRIGRPGNRLMFGGEFAYPPLVTCLEYYLSLYVSSFLNLWLIHYLARLNWDYVNTEMQVI